MVSENDKHHSEESGTSSDTNQQWMEAILSKKVRLLQWMGLNDARVTNKDTEDTSACAGGGKGASVATGQSEQRCHATGGSNPTPRGMSMGDRDSFLPEGRTAFGGILMGFP